ncbi:hypothetical protein AB0K92_16015 [Streptomyces sp. NPDC052687]|uniref:hypothetical protein n=1 Tax=Streptomyces sp. NPDC052687 TaxID=3154759 RepID=UPI0034308B95
MAEQCLTPDYDEGPCHCDYCDPGRLRDDRIETYCQGWGAREMAERIVELEDEIGADVDGVCTGMHADVAEAQAEVERLKDRLRYEHNRANSAIDREETAEKAVEELQEELSRLVDHTEASCVVVADRDRYKAAWQSARRRASRAMGAWRFQQRTIESLKTWRRKDEAVIRELVVGVAERSSHLNRYRLAWLSARRRAADEANFGMEALALRDSEIRRLRAKLGEAP